MSLKNTLADASSNATPVEKIASSTMITSSTGNHGNTMLPATSSATVSTPNSISTVTNWANTTDSTRCSCGKATFLISEAPPCTVPIDTPTLIEKKLKGMKPHKK